MKCEVCSGEMVAVSEKKDDVVIAVTFECKVCGQKRDLFYFLMS